MEKTSGKKPKKATGRSAATTSATKLVAGKQPQSKQQAANQAGMFLHTDDAWSLAYYNADDLHYLERELFG